MSQTIPRARLPGRAGRGDPSTRAAARIRGPQSALTDFLQEKGISAADIRSTGYAGTRRPGSEAERVETGSENALEGASASASTRVNANNDASNADEQQGIVATESATINDNAEDEEIVPSGVSRGKKRVLVDSDDEAEAKASPAKTSKQIKDDVKKMKAKKAAAKKKAEEDAMEDANVSSVFKRPGTVDFCVKCGKKFTVTIYSKPNPVDEDDEESTRGLLCHQCGNLYGKKPEKKVVQKKPRKRPQLMSKFSEKIQHAEDSGVRSLVKICVDFIAAHIEDVESLPPDYISALNMNRICQVLSKNRKLTDDTVGLFLVNGGMRTGKKTEIRLYDCAKLGPDKLMNIAQFCPNIITLQMNHVGKLNDANIKFYGERLKELNNLQLSGPYLVTIPAWKAFFSSIGSRLKSFIISDTSRFDISCLQALLENCGESLEVLGLHRITRLDEEAYKLLPKFQNLKHFELAYPECLIPDEILIDVFKVCGNRLEKLHLAKCHSSDGILIEGLLPYCTKLESLTLIEMDSLLDDGFIELFSSWKNPGLQKADFTRCTEITDAGLQPFLSHSFQTQTSLSINSMDLLGPETFKEMWKIKSYLLQDLDVSWIRSVSDEAVALISTACENLKVLHVWGDNRITECVETPPNLRLIGKDSDI